ncbi:MAG: hypothetical protein ACT4PV_08890 [Planctomycetaceae bacterium]
MKSAYASMILAAFALGGVGLLLVKLDRLSERVETLTHRRSEAARSDTDAERPWPEVPPPAHRAPDRSGAPQDGARSPDHGGAEARPAEERLADVERWIAEREQAEESGHAAELHRGHVGTRNRWYHSVDQLASDLKLTQTQKDRVKDAVERGKQRIEEVLKIPDESGKSPYDRRREAQERIKQQLTEKGPGEMAALVLTDFLGHENKPIPGRSATYGAEVERVKRETREEIAASLDPKQREQLEGASLDPLLGNSANMEVSIAVASFEAGDAVQVEPGK